MIDSSLTVITHTHNTSLAFAAIVVSVVAAITGLALMNNIRTLPESRRKAVIVMASFLLGGGIWSMHFLAMLSINFPVPIHYDLLQTLGSGLIAVLVVGFALLLLHFRQRTQRTLNGAGLCLGLGIVSMHVVGMLGMRGVILDFNIVALAVASLLALFLGMAAIRVSYRARSRLNIVKGGLMFGLAVVVVHYTAMIGTQFSVDPDYQKLTIALNQESLAIAVSVAGFVICGTFLLAASTFVPSPMPTSVNVPRSTSIDHSVGTPTQTDSTPAQTDDKPTLNDPTLTNESTLKRLPLPVKIPYEQLKQILFVDSSDVGAIRADGRYTQLYTRDGVKFCPWSITEAEKRLVGVRFYRSHRSYLINIAAVAGFEKQRDSGVCRFEGFIQLTHVPVSRARVNELTVELGV